jgi:rhamnogalacturonyl hydrolase YesR
MKIFKKGILLIVIITALSCITETNKSDVYKNEMESLLKVVQDNYYDSASGYYFVELVPEKRETKFGHKREYSWFWALCATFEAANEVEKVLPDAQLVEPIFDNLNNYYDTSEPAPGYNEYIVDIKPGLRYYDDNQWIGITALDIYNRTQEKKYLDLGKEMYQFMMTAYDTTLGGGLYWRETDFETKNTCSNGPGIIVALKLYEITKEESYLDTALMIYNWTNEKLQSPSGLYYDNIKTSDGSLNKTIFSYNTGTMLQSNIYLYELTGEKKYLEKANAIADSSLAYFYGGEKFKDHYWFNAVLLRGYQHLLKHNPDLKYIKGFKKCLDNV